MHGMAVALHTSFTGDKALYSRAIERGKDSRGYLRSVGMFLTSQGLHRCTTVLKMNPAGKGAVARRTGRLTASLRVTSPAQGNADAVWRETPASIEVGTHVPYAAQINYGGEIRPRPPGKAIAIPLISQLRGENAMWPRDLDPTRKRLQFIPTKTGRSIGVLVARDDDPQFPGQLLYVLVAKVTQRPRPFWLLTREDVAEIMGMWAQWLKQPNYPTQGRRGVA